eukprot:403361851
MRVSTVQVQLLLLLQWLKIPKQRKAERLVKYLKQKHLQKYSGLNSSNQSSQALDSAAAESIKRRVRETIRDWVNFPSRGDEGFYPLHFASFHGNVKLIKLLVKCGANVFARNKQGINMLHVAAQGDQAYSLTYFKNKNVSLIETDGEHSTPLHWACFAGSDTAIYYLLAWGLEVNARDNLGNTPLNLAIKSADNFPNTRAIKELLIKGAEKQAKDNIGRMPIEFTKEIQNEQLSKELYTLLLERHYKTLMIYVVLIILTFIALMLCVFPYLNGNEIPTTCIVLFCMANIFFLVTWRTDPGYLQKSQKVSFLRLVEKFDPNMLCPTCEVICTSESRHCYICNKCVERFDHHYVDNDISQIYKQRLESEQLLPIIFQNWDTAQLVYQLVIIGCVTMATFFLIPLTFLFIVQTQNFLYNQTTNKRFSKYKRPSANDQAIASVADLREQSDDDEDFKFPDLQSMQQQNQERRKSSKNNDLETLPKSASVISKIQPIDSPISLYGRRQTQRGGLSAYFRNCMNMCCSNQYMNQNDIYMQYQNQLRQGLTNDLIDDDQLSGTSSKGSMITKILFEFEDSSHDELDHRSKVTQQSRSFVINK